jgi:PAS domain S-box-containing protein
MADQVRTLDGFYESAFHLSAIGIALVATDGRILQVNQAFSTMIGYSPGELLRMSAQEITHPEDLPREMEAFRRLISGEVPPYEIEKRYRHKQGHLIWAKLDVSLVRDSAGKPHYVVAQIQDMTEKKRLEAAVRQSEKMSAVGQMAAGMAQQLSAPLFAMQESVQSAAHAWGSHDSRIRALQALEKEIQQCRSLVQALLTFSQDQKPSQTPEDPARVLEGALMMVEAQTSLHHIELVRDIRRSLPSIQVDRRQIQQVILNLCANAIESMPEGGRLTVGLDATETNLEIRVRDTGRGIAPELRDRIFDPFVTTKNPAESTGLGLSLAYQIIRNHQGQIEFQSEIDQGTTFIIRLPLKPVVESTPAKQSVLFKN